MKAVVFLILLLFALSLVWRYLIPDTERATVKRLLRQNLWVLFVIAVLVLGGCYSLWVLSLSGGTVKFL